MVLSSYDLVIFDCDGVLVDSERLTVHEEARMLTELGWPVTADEVVGLFMGRAWPRSWRWSRTGSVGQRQRGSSTNWCRG